MNEYTAKAIILSALFGGIALAVIASVWASAWRARGEAKRSEGISVMEWANRLHDLAEVFKETEGADNRVVGRVLMDYAHLLRAGHPYCKCKKAPQPEDAGQF